MEKTIMVSTMATAQVVSPKSKKVKEFLADYMLGTTIKGLCEKYGYSATVAHAMLPRYRAYIRNLMAAGGLTPEYVMDLMHERVLRTKNDQAAIAGIRTMGEWLGMSSAKLDITVNDDMSKLSTPELVARIKSTITDLEEKNGIFQTKSIPEGIIEPRPENIPDGCAAGDSGAAPTEVPEQPTLVCQGSSGV